MTWAIEKTSRTGFKLGIVMLVSPIVLLAFHVVLMVPSVLLVYPIAHFRGDYAWWGRAASWAAMLPSGWGAFVVCRLI